MRKASLRRWLKLEKIRNISPAERGPRELRKAAK